MTIEAALLAWLRSRLPEMAGAALLPVAPLDRPRFDDGLLGDEQRLIRHARPIRQAEFTAGRIAARRALAAMGIAPAALMTHAAGDPIWPAAVVGSISHAQGWAVAVAARQEDLCGVGVDIEGAGPLEPGVMELVCRPDERSPEPALRRRGIDSGKLRFVAKEAWYKAVFPQCRRFVDFNEVRIEVDPTTDTFRARFVGLPPTDGIPPTADGHFMLVGDLLSAVCAVPRDR